MVTYKARKRGQTIRDIYPALLKRLGTQQKSLRKPLISACNLDGTTLQFTITLVKDSLNHLSFNYPWRTLTTLRSRQGVDLDPYSRIKINAGAGN